MSISVYLRVRLYLCVCLLVCVCVCSHLCCAHVEARNHYQVCSLFFIFLLTWLFSLSLELINRLAWLATEHSESSSLFAASGFQVQTNTPSFLCGLWDPELGPYLMQQVLYELRISPRLILYVVIVKFPACFLAFWHSISSAL